MHLKHLRYIKSSIASLAALLTICAVSFAQAQSTYVTTQSGLFGQMDLSTGAFTQIGGPVAPVYGLGFGTNGSLYGLSGNGNLSIIDTSTGAFTLVGSTGLGANTNLMASLSNGQLYAVDLDFNLYLINQLTAAATLIGSTGIPSVAGSQTGFADSMAADGTTLYITNAIYDGMGGYSQDPTLYAINPFDASTVTVGPLGPLLEAVGAGFVNGNLYAFPFNAQSQMVSTINTADGVSTGVFNTAVTVFAAASNPVVVPEPASVVLLLAGGGAFCFAAIRKSKARRVASRS